MSQRDVLYPSNAPYTTGILNVTQLRYQLLCCIRRNHNQAIVVMAPGAVAVAFRGTANWENVRTDLKLWRAQAKLGQLGGMYVHSCCWYLCAAVLHCACGSAPPPPFVHPPPPRGGASPASSKKKRISGRTCDRKKKQRGHSVATDERRRLLGYVVPIPALDCSTVQESSACCLPNLVGVQHGEDWGNMEGS